MAHLALPNFFDRYKERPKAFRQRAPLLFTLISSDSEPQEAAVALEQARSFYGEHNYRAALNSLDQGLRGIFEEPVEYPRQGHVSQQVRLRHLAEILTLWEKSCAWLGIDDGIPATTYLADLDVIYNSLGDRDAASRLRSTYAYRYLNSGSFEDAVTAIDMGLRTAHSLPTIRFLKEAKGSLARKLEFFPEAARLFSEVRRLDDKIEEISQASRSLPVAWLGILQGLGSGRSRYEGIYMALKASDLCAATGHIGFQSQILLGLVNCLIEIRDYEGAREMLSNLRELLAKFPKSFPGLTTRSEQAALFLATESKGGLQGLAASTEWVTLHETVSAIQWKPLRAVFRACLREALEEEPYAGRSLLCSAAEHVTEALFEKSGLEERIEEKKRSLRNKNAELYNAGVYKDADFTRMQRLSLARNKVFHAMPGATAARQLGRSVAILETVAWLNRLVRDNGLHQYIPKGSKREREWRRWLLGGL